MASTLGRVSTLLLAVAILLVGHGLQLSVLPLRAGALDWSTAAIGLTGSAYFVGFVVGCLIIPSVVAQVAHIRTFMVMAALATTALLALGLLDHLAAWLALRLCTGFAFAGLYMVIESWLSESATEQSRGSVLAVYSMISLLAMMLGQALLGVAGPLDLELIMLAALIMALAILPIGLTRMTAPPAIPRARFSPRVLLRASRVAVVCAFFGGLVTGAFWSIGPLVAQALGLTGTDIGVMMGAGIVGGALAQFPVGRLSDHFDRRRVIAALMAVGALVSALGWWLAPGGVAALLVVVFCVGATAMPVYALCIATAADNAEVPLIQITSGILVMNSLGSILGPLLVAPLMATLGGAGFFLFAAAALLLGALWALYRISVVERPSRHEHRFLAVPRTSIVAAELAEPAPDPQAPEAPPAPTDSGR